MSANAYFKCYPSDFLNGIIGLTAPEIAVYTVTMMMQYDRREPVRPNVRAIAARCSLRPGIVTAAISSLIEAGKLVATASGWSNPRAAREIEILNSSATISQQNGNRGGRKQNGKANEINDPPNPERTQSEPVTRSQKPEAPNGAAGAGTPTHTHTREGTGDLAKQFEARVLASSPALNAAYARSPGLYDLSPVHRWLAAGYDLEADILPPVLAHFARGATVPRSWAYFQAAVTEAAEKRAAMTPKPFEAPRGPTFPFDEHGRRLKDGPHVTVYFGTLRHPGELHLAEAVNARSNWIAAVREFRKTGQWCRQLLGPTPDEPGHYVPARAIERADEAAVTPEQFDAIMNRTDTGESQPHLRRHH